MEVEYYQWWKWNGVKCGRNGVTSYRSGVMERRVTSDGRGASNGICQNAWMLIFKCTCHRVWWCHTNILTRLAYFFLECFDFFLDKQFEYPGQRSHITKIFSSMKRLSSDRTHIYCFLNKIIKYTIYTIFFLANTIYTNNTCIQQLLYVIRYMYKHTISII